MKTQHYRDRHMPQIEVDAVQLTAENVDEVAKWCNGTQIVESNPLDPSQKFVGINVPTPHGYKRASEGDYVVLGSWGEFYRAKPGGFQRDFDLTETGSTPTEADDPFEGMERA